MRLTYLKNNYSYLIKLCLAVLLIVLAVVFRLLPHPPNFAPIAALAIFSGAILPKKWALSLPLAAMVMSDFIIGFHSLIWLTWSSFLVIALISSKVVNKFTPLRILSTSLGASIFFFIVTNLGVWLEGRLYPLTGQGLVNCYINAIPFFRNTLLGDFVFCGALFGAYYAICRYSLKNTSNLKVSAVKS